MLVRTLMLFVALMLVSCGTATSATSGPESAVEPAPVTAADVHQQFIEALRSSDRQAALDLTGDISLKEGMVDKWLGDGTALQRDSHFDGKFTQVEVLAPAVGGQGQTAISVWHRERGQTCYQAKLSMVDSGWKVIDWSWMGQGGCPKS